MVPETGFKFTTELGTCYGFSNFSQLGSSRLQIACTQIGFSFATRQKETSLTNKRFSQKNRVQPGKAKRPFMPGINFHPRNQVTRPLYPSLHYGN